MVVLCADYRDRADRNARRSPLLALSAEIREYKWGLALTYPCVLVREALCGERGVNTSSAEQALDCKCLESLRMIGYAINLANGSKVPAAFHTLNTFVFECPIQHVNTLEGHFHQFPPLKPKSHEESSLRRVVAWSFHLKIRIIWDEKLS
ncbi:hypothetical protein BU23DRAFT_552540 [Bimuria novae-zelandiae CBS 107.79]|uniref:Uncharacterized protein n=1 Tax=Bimuria novae-zelandiae CBS 107.79 TaxID=1447943 RepID=A0A6A5VE80_9PLEO|nr:hypothetical protein BU23DRAFT_552540 [Bimuria novae-zelandiae CBS 107.79]